MGLFDRIVLAVYTVSLGVLATTFVLLSIGWRTPLDIVGTSLKEMQGRWLIGTVSALYLIISLRFVYLAFRRKYGGQTVMHETDLGEIRISLEAVENLVKKVARQCQGVRDVSGQVQIRNGTLIVSLRIIVSPDISIPSVSNEVQTSVKSYVRNVVGVEVTEVSVFVENITAEVRKSRVE